MTHRNSKTSMFVSAFVLASAAFTALAGIAVLIGRLTHSSSFILLLPHYAPIQFNTALAFTFSGLALLFAHREMRRTSFWSASFVALIGGVTLLEYATGYLHEFDQFFAQPYLSAIGIYPGRMAPDTAVCFFSIGLALIVQNRRWLGRFSAFFGAILGLLILLMATASFRSYFAEMHTAYAWGNFGRMTFQAAIQLLLFGTALFLHMTEKDSRHTSNAEVYIPAGVALIFLLGTIGVWQGLIRDDAKTIRAATAVQAASSVRLIEKGLESRILALERMADRWNYRGGTPRGEWEDDATNYYQDLPGFLAISRVDPSFIVRWVYPEEVAQALVGFNVKTGPDRTSAVNEALRTRHTALTKIITLKQGGEGFGIYIPLYKHGAFDGILGSGFKISTLIETLLSLNGYEIFIKEGDRPIYINGSATPEYLKEWSADAQLNYREIHWTFTMAPTAETLRAQSSNLPMMILLTGLLVSLLFGTIARLLILSRSSRMRTWSALEWRRRLMDSTQHMIIATDNQGKIVTFNAAAEKALGYQADEVVGKETPLLFRDTEEVSDRAKTMSAILGRPVEAGFEALISKAKRGLVEEQELTYVTKSGRKFPVAITITALHGADHEITGYLVVAVDITERKQAQQSLEQAKEAALESARAKASFLANMSHEIRTPLNGIIGMADLLNETDLDHQQRKYSKIIQDSGNGLLTIINDILDFSKIEAGKMNLECVDFRLTPVIEGQVDLLASRAREKDISLITFIDPRISYFIKGDPGRIGQILLNLIGNAIKFTSVGSIVVRAELHNTLEEKVKIRFSVKDSGIGMSTSVTKTLFQPFVQADDSTARKYGGTGLGLSISKRIVELMGGEIGVDSEEGKGSCFWFTCVLDRAQTTEEAPRPAEELSGLRVLVVDDDLISSEIIARYLSNWGFKPSLAKSGHEALGFLKMEAAAQEPIDLVIIDKRMPVMDGFVLADRIREEPSIAALPLILATAFDRSSQKENALKHGFSAYVTKPLKQSELYDAIVSAMKLKQTPAPTSQTVQRDDKYVPPIPINNKGRRVLVAEDNAVNQLLILTMLKNLNYAAIAVANGREVLDALSRAPYDIVLMDCQMPELDGFDTTKAIREREKETGHHIPIIALTANAMKEDELRCLSVGMDDYLSKPVKKEKLGETLLKWLSRDQSNQSSNKVA